MFMLSRESHPWAPPPLGPSEVGALSPPSAPSRARRVTSAFPSLRALPSLHLCGGSFPTTALLGARRATVRAGRAGRAPPPRTVRLPFSPSPLLPVLPSSRSALCPLSAL